MCFPPSRAALTEYLQCPQMIMQNIQILDSCSFVTAFSKRHPYCLVEIKLIEILPDLGLKVRLAFMEHFLFLLMSIYNTV